eukprot:5279166-Pyramimonas_sp.AAC.1
MAFRNFFGCIAVWSDAELQGCDRLGSKKKTVCASCLSRCQVATTIRSAAHFWEQGLMDGAGMAQGLISTEQGIVVQEVDLNGLRNLPQVRQGWDV